MLNVLLIFCSVQMYGYRVPFTNKIDPRCYEQDNIRAWIYFTDKGVRIDEYSRAIKAVQDRLNKESLKRRLARKGIIDYADIPVSGDYIGEIEARGGFLIRKSKWLNAASFMIARRDLENIAQLPFVQKVVPVAQYTGSAETETAVQDTAIFGFAYRQFRMFNIDTLRALGDTGSNVRVGFLDSGLRRKHTALSDINLIGEYDFLGGDQVFMENTPITEKYGVYGSAAFRRSAGTLYLFLEGDTVLSYAPTHDVLLTYSKDDGATWSPLKKLTNQYQNWVTELEACGQDTIYVLYRGPSGLYYLVMADTVMIVPPIWLSPLYREPTGVQVSDTVYVFYHSPTTLYLRKGISAGFLPQAAVDSSSAAVKSPKAVGSDTMVGLFYYNFPSDSLFFIRSKIPIAPSFTKSYIAAGKNPEAVSRGDSLFLTYQDIGQSPLFRVAFTKSYDFGGSFTAPLYLSENLNSIGKIAVEKSGNNIVVAWETEGKVYSRTSLDNGENFGNLDSLNKDFAYLPTLGTTNAAEIVKFYCQRGDTNTDGYTTDDPSHYFYPKHGTEMLGLVGGYLSGTYMGVAPGAQLLMAKTENPDRTYEFPVEEDTWVAGLEWLESKGADIVSSSLGYTTGYSWPGDYDGTASVASIAATEATKRGVIVVNASGNFVQPTSPQIVIPGDAARIITVGGIDTLFNHAKWESQGLTAYAGYWPTADPPKKPEIVALCAAPIVVDPDSVNSYLYSYGTSGATALVSGICALLLEGHPYWNVDSVRNALFETASFADSPSDSLGYGWPDALAAFYYTTPAWDAKPGNHFLTPYPNPFIIESHQHIYLPFKLQDATSVEFRIYSINGRLITKLERPEGTGQLAPGVYNNKDPLAQNAAFIWDGKDDQGKEVGSGLYYGLLITRGYGNDVTKIAVVR